MCFPLPFNQNIFRVRRVQPLQRRALACVDVGFLNDLFVRRWVSTVMQYQLPEPNAVHSRAVERCGGRLEVLSSATVLAVHEVTVLDGKEQEHCHV